MNLLVILRIIIANSLLRNFWFTQNLILVLLRNCHIPHVSLELGRNRQNLRRLKIRSKVIIKRKYKNPNQKKSSTQNHFFSRNSENMPKVKAEFPIDFLQIKSTKYYNMLLKYYEKQNERLKNSLGRKTTH